MSAAALSLAKQAYSALNREKPHSSITDLVEILTSPSYEDEAFDGIPELVESINLQPTAGPIEASRAIRKKLKHGDSHRQYRALVLLKAMVDNGGHTFQTTFADGQLTDAIKHLASDPGTDSKVKRKLVSMLMSWHRQFQGDASMTLVANLYKSVPSANSHAAQPRVVQPGVLEQESEYEKRKREEREAKEEAKRKAKQAKIEERERMRKEAEARLKAKNSKGRTRAPFDFEKERPQVLNSIAETSQAANNLVNSLTLVNTEQDSVQENARVQECLEKAKLARKRVIRYIQLVENEELIGTLLETNERVIAALQMYDKLASPNLTAEDVREVEERMAAVKVHHSGEVDRLQEKQRAAVQRSKNRVRDRDQDPGNVHPDLQDLSFGELGADQRNLPPPIRPSAPESGDDETVGRGSLSDFSDYDSSDEETHNQPPAPGQASTSYGSNSARRGYVSVSDEEAEAEANRGSRKGLLEDDPFADPFADQGEVSTPGITNKKGMNW